MLQLSPHILASEQLVQIVAEHIQDVCQDQGQHQRQLADCEDAIREARTISARLLKLARQKDNPPPSLLLRLMSAMKKLLASKRRKLSS